METRYLALCFPGENNYTRLYLSLIHILARLVVGRCTNKEIAAALYLSEGTVKQYINQLYAKLDMGGDPRTDVYKRQPFCNC